MKKGKRPLWEEPVVEVPASLARVNEERMNVKTECETAGPRKSSGRALLKRGADALEGTSQNKTREEQQDRMQMLPVKHLKERKNR
jgi:hypothetical protein